MPFLEPDHPLGVGPIERLVEDLAPRRRRRCRRPGSARCRAAWRPQRPFARPVARRSRPATSPGPGSGSSTPEGRPRTRSPPLRATAAAAAMRWPGSGAAFMDGLARPTPSALTDRPGHAKPDGIATGPLPTSRKPASLKAMRGPHPQSVPHSAEECRHDASPRLSWPPASCLLGDGLPRRDHRRAARRQPPGLPRRGRIPITRTATSPS